MANVEQVAILQQGVQVWNEWREKNPAGQWFLFESNRHYPCLEHQVYES